METQICYGSNVETENLHNVTDVRGDTTNYRVFANAAFKRYDLTIFVPLGWHFEGEPQVHLVSQNRDAIEAFAWNNFSVAHDRFFVTERNPNYIKCTCWAGSHPMVINLQCTAVKEH